MSHRLILFAKAPRLGTVKTRLHESLSKHRARRLYIAFLKDTLTMARRVRCLRHRVVAFTPTAGERTLRRAVGLHGRGFQFTPQGNGNLGERMSRAFEESVEGGCARTVIIGTDSPTLPVRLVEEAFAALRDADLVLGPSMDGGYCLIGLRAQCARRGVARLFRGVEWSTERVLEQTVANARSARLKLQLLDPWYDVDNAGSLRFLRAHLLTMAASGSKELPKHTWRVLREGRMWERLPRRERECL